MFDLRARELPAHVTELRQEVRAFLDQELSSGAWAPGVDTWLGGFDPQFSRRLGERGWIGMTWPRRYGGHERSALERFVVLEELLAAGAPVAAHWVADRQVGPLLLRFGREDQLQRYLPAIASGECCFAIGMSEPDSGSDLASIRTRAVPDGDGWRVTGTKIWTTSAHKAQFINVLVRTGDPDGRHVGLSQLLMDMASPGITVRPVHLLNGEHHFNEVFFDDVFVPASGLIGELGSGWEQVTTELSYERSGPERFLSVLPLVKAFVDAHQDGLDAAQAAVLGTLTAKLWALRQLSISVVTQLEAGGNVEVAAALVKDIGTSLEQESIERLREVISVAPGRHAAGDVLHELLALAVEHSPGFTLRGGTNQILRTIIARGLGL